MQMPLHTKLWMNNAVVLNGQDSRSMPSAVSERSDGYLPCGRLITRSQWVSDSDFEA